MPSLYLCLDWTTGLTLPGRSPTPATAGRRAAAAAVGVTAIAASRTEPAPAATSSSARRRGRPCRLRRWLCPRRSSGSRCHPSGTTRSSGSWGATSCTPTPSSPRSPPPCPGGRVAPESATVSRACGAAVRALTELSSKSSSPSSCVRVGVDAGRRDGDDADREPGAVAQRHPCRRRHAVAQTALLGAVQPQGRRRLRVGVVVGLRVGTGAPAQLGKMNIASWASKEESLLAAASPEKGAGDMDEEIKRKAFEARATAWDESKKCKLASRYQRKEVKIQEWESLKKSKFEAKLRQAKAQAEQMKARAKQDLARRLSALSHKVEGKQARVEARRSRQASWLARQVETGREACRLRRCCAWFL
ncbi:uncharacterized protein [Miscanthus floridulus]|uniref:uncharacterized protein n=1 Tax=Miscanthus floridulus TaxID=154761 RepID=UPI003458F24C